MIEKVNPKHPDKVADRIAGAIVDLAYTKQENPKVAVEVLIGHGECDVIIESSYPFGFSEIEDIVCRVTGDDSIFVNLISEEQDKHLAGNQKDKIRCGDNGIFKGMPLTDEQKELSQIAREFYEQYNSDGKYIFDAKAGRLIICQSNAKTEEIKKDWPDAEVNPLGD